MKSIGILLLLNVVVVAGYFLFSTAVEVKRILAFSSVGFLLGIGLIIGDRIIGVKVTGVGELTAATERAVVGAEKVEAIQREVEEQRDSIAMIVRDANAARDDIKRIDDYALTAKKKAEEAEQASKKATDAQQELTNLADFNLLLTKANNDDRKAFDRLRDTANRGASPLKEIAFQAVVNIATNRLSLDISASDWPRFFFAPATATLAEYTAMIMTGRPDVARSALNELWKQERFTKRQKLELSLRVIQQTTSVGVLEGACLTVNAEAKVNKNILAWPDYIVWWDSHKDLYF